MRIGVADTKKILFDVINESTRQARAKILELVVSFVLSAEKQVGPISGVFVVTGPGSFSAIRTGIAVAQTFAYVRKIPIVGAHDDIWKNHVQYIKQLKLGGVIKAKYGQPPSITRPQTATKHLKRNRQLRAD